MAMIYYPYVRGKQYELVALREMCSFVNNKEILSPIIEPVKEVNSTMVKTIEYLRDGDINFNIILNPQNGSVKQAEYGVLTDAILSAIGEEYTNYQPAFIINEKVDARQVNKFIEDRGFNGITLIINQIPKNEVEFDRLLSSGKIKCIVLRDDDSGVRRLGRKVPGADKVLLSDRFIIKDKNADYAHPDDEPFTEDHLYYSDEGYSGFSDYLTIGDIYKEGGFSPYAVAIHLTHIVPEDQKIRVHHFVSDSNDDYEDVPRKFKEALAKLVPFIDARDIHTNACEQFRQIRKDGTYHGLGPIKKLSILHHIELVYNYFTQQ